MLWIWIVILVVITNLLSFFIGGLYVMRKIDRMSVKATITLEEENDGWHPYLVSHVPLEELAQDHMVVVGVIAHSQKKQSV